MIPYYLPANGLSTAELLPETLERLRSQASVTGQRPSGLYLTNDRGALGLAHGAYPKQRPVTVDFLTGVSRHRQRYGGGRSQAIARAVGLSRNPHLSVLDATAGLGRDAFVLACLGAEVRLLERHPVVRLLLADGLARGRLQDPDLFSRLILCAGSLLDADLALPRPDVVYLDPMFPERRGKAAVKKEMALFHELVGADEDADRLLPPALALARRRVVVKRPRIAPTLAGEPPTRVLAGKSNRFDIYALRSVEPVNLP